MGNRNNSARNSPHAINTSVPLDSATDCSLDDLPSAAPLGAGHLFGRIGIDFILAEPEDIEHQYLTDEDLQAWEDGLDQEGLNGLQAEMISVPRWRLAKSKESYADMEREILRDGAPELATIPPRRGSMYPGELDALIRADRARSARHTVEWEALLERRPDIGDIIL